MSGHKAVVRRTKGLPNQVMGTCSVWSPTFLPYHPTLGTRGQECPGAMLTSEEGPGNRHQCGQGGTGQSRGRDQGVPTEALAGVAVPTLGTRSGGGGLPGIPKEGPFSP